MATRILISGGVLLIFLTACAVPSTPSLPRASTAFDFNWHLRGERAVGPIQVFDNGQQTWIQFSPEQSLPVVLAVDQQGEQALELIQRGQFHVVLGTWDRLVFRDGSRRAQAFRQGMEPLDFSLTPVLAATTQSVAVSVRETAPTETSALSEPTNMALVLNPTPDEHPEQARTYALASAATPYAVQRLDQTLRQALQRWAIQAGWVFEAEHWSVDIDYPISAAAQFDTDFQQSVQALLASTEMSEHPLQPCFYTNHVLRVINWTQACDHSAPLTGQSS